MERGKNYMIIHTMIRLSRCLLACVLLCAVAVAGFSQDKNGIWNIDDAINDFVEDLEYNPNVPKNSGMAVFNRFSTEYGMLSSHIADELQELLAQSSSFSLVDRTNTELIRQEQIYQADYVSENDAASIGNELGVSIIITGSIELFEKTWQLKLGAVEVVSRRNTAFKTYRIGNDRQMRELTKSNQKPVPLYKFYAGGRGGFAIRGYQMASGEFQQDWVENYNFFFGGVSLSFYPFRNFALQAEMYYNRDIVKYSGTETHFGDPYPYAATFDSTSIIAPVTIKYAFRLPVLRPGFLVVAPFGGVYFSIPIGDMTYSTVGYETKTAKFAFSNPMGLTVGVDFGVSLGRVVLSLGARYCIDLGNTSIRDDTGVLAVYRRNFVSFTLGFEFGIGESR
jgi:hypothetical protein